MIRETQSTNSNGAVSFAALPLGCSYSLSIASQDLCWYSASSQLVAAGGTATFAIDASLLDSSALVIPPDTTVSCLADTSPATTGYATLCGASLTFADTVTKKECSGPGGLLAIIKRAWSYESHIRTQTINVVDSKTIIFTSVPASTTVPCNQSPPPSQANATSCTAVTITSSESSAAVSCDSSTCSPRRYLVRTFTATDLCGNTASRTQTFTEACGSAWKSQPAPPPPSPVCPPHRRQTAASSAMTMTWHKHLAYRGHHRYPNTVVAQPSQSQDYRDLSGKIVTCFHLPIYIQQGRNTTHTNTHASICECKYAWMSNDIDRVIE